MRHSWAGSRGLRNYGWGCCFRHHSLPFLTNKTQTLAGYVAALNKNPFPCPTPLWDADTHNGHQHMSRVLWGSFQEAFWKPSPLPPLSLPLCRCLKLGYDCFLDPKKKNSRFYRADSWKQPALDELHRTLLALTTRTIYQLFTQEKKS